MDVRKTLLKLFSEYGISGNEEAAANVAKSLLEPLCDKVYISGSGSVIGIKKGKNENGIKVMLDAHIDEIGLMVSAIDEKGFLRFTTVGGVDAKGLPGSEVVVFGRERLCGIIGTKPPHLQVSGESDEAFSADELAIDIGFSKERAKELVSVGDFVGFSSSVSILGENCIAHKSMDNRAGVCAILYAAEKLKNEELDGDIYYVFSAGEEVNMNGAVTAANELCPDAAIAVDVTFGVSDGCKESSFVLGGGPSYSIGPNVSKRVQKIIEKCAEELKIDIHPEVEGGSTGTNAWGIQISKTGVMTGVVSIPLRYMHTPVETVDIRDIISVGEIVSKFAKEAEKLERMEEVKCC